MQGDLQSSGQSLETDPDFATQTPDNKMQIQEAVGTRVCINTSRNNFDLVRNGYLAETDGIVCSGVLDPSWALPQQFVRIFNQFLPGNFFLYNISEAGTM